MEKINKIKYNDNPNNPGFLFWVSKFVYCTPAIGGSYSIAFRRIFILIYAYT